MQRLLRISPPHFPRLPTRTFSTTTPLSSFFQSGPAPPRLPKEEQEIFEKLQRQSTGAFSTPRVNQSPDSSSSDAAQQSTKATHGEGGDVEGVGNLKVPKVEVEEGDVHPNLRRGAPPEFEGDVNPKTGEVGGPKNEPLRWGASGDWSFNGRVTDF
ncbi:DUF1674-domain-containing protein [Sporormia fimetaria CBS 119925]|uniref:Succinate dehydrogenase assembly factor 4, mitochondrial n=1 Tax=Sporormia fimetaria CBS 119925 TaxID=1340428 RepID=A0A6A6VGA9_9PLEO|nr:DUF1674-domain-containing protein [Sporormia fimetaria CBS 119925]